MDFVQTETYFFFQTNLNKETQVQTVWDTYKALKKDIRILQEQLKNYLNEEVCWNLKKYSRIENI